MNGRLLDTANDIESALTAVSILFARGEHSLLVKNTGASKSQYDKLNKELRKAYPCTRTTDGFIVHNAARPKR